MCYSAFCLVLLLAASISRSSARTLRASSTRSLATSSTNDELGYWGKVFDTNVMAIHAMLLPDSQVLLHGATVIFDGLNAIQGGPAGNHSYDVWNPTSGDHHSAISEVSIQQFFQPDTNIFCSTASMDISTGNILILGGDDGAQNGIAAATEFNTHTLAVTKHPLGEMHYPRWYGSSVNLPDGRIFVIGGSGENFGFDPSGIPEIWSPTEGFRTLPNANVASIRLPFVGMHWNEGYWYPNVYVNSAGEVIVTTTGLIGTLERYQETKFLAEMATEHLGFLDSALVYKVGVEGEGTAEWIGIKPFSSNRLGASIMYRVDKVAFLDNNGYIWSADISPGKRVAFTRMVHNGIGRRTNAAFALLPDGRVTISGGCTKKGEGNNLDTAVYTLQIWDPDSNTIFDGPEMDIARLYHSSSIILPAGTVFAGGGGAPGPLQNDNAQLYFPGYLFNEDGSRAKRPVIEDCPDDSMADTTIFIMVDNARDIRRVTTTKSGQMTHSKNFDARWIELSFTVISDNKIEVPLPNRNVMIPGLWMVNVINAKGVPSVASLMSVNMGYYCGTCDSVDIN